MKSNKPNEVVKKHEKRQIIAAEQFKGPIPPPEIFRKYGEVVHDAPERILKVFEQDSQHTREMQKLALTHDAKRDGRAQWMTFFIMIAALGLTAIAIIFGKNIAPGIITGLATLFLALKVLFSGRKNTKNGST